MVQELLPGHVYKSKETGEEFYISSIIWNRLTCLLSTTKPQYEPAFEVSFEEMEMNYEFVRDEI